MVVVKWLVKQTLEAPKNQEETLLLIRYLTLSGQQV